MSPAAAESNERTVASRAGRRVGPAGIEALSIADAIAATTVRCDGERKAYTRASSSGPFTEAPGPQLANASSALPARPAWINVRLFTPTFTVRLARSKIPLL